MKIFIPRGNSAFSIPAEREEKKVWTLKERLLGNDNDNDFSVPLPYRDREDQEQQLVIRPMDARELRAYVQGALADGAEPDKQLTIFPAGRGTPVGTIGLAAIDDALNQLR